MAFKDLVRSARKEKGLRQVDVANRLGVNQVTVGDYERGKSYPELTRLNILAVVLDLDFEELQKIIIQEKRERTIGKADFRAQAALDVVVPMADREQAKQELVEKFRQLSSSQQERVRGYIDALLAQNNG